MHLPAATLSTSKPHMQAARRCKVHTKHKRGGTTQGVSQNPANQESLKKKEKKGGTGTLSKEEKKNPRQQKQRQHKARGGMSLD